MQGLIHGLTENDEADCESKRGRYGSPVTRSRLNTNTSSRTTFRHALDYIHTNTAMKKAQNLHMKSMQVPVENPNLHVAETIHDLDAEPLRVHVLLQMTSTPSFSSTKSIVTIQISPAQVKTFEFAAGMEVQIPRSTTRRTIVSVTAIGQTVRVFSVSSSLPEARMSAAPARPVQMFLVDKATKKTTAEAEITMLPNRQADNLVYALVTTKEDSLGFKFPFYNYERDVPATNTIFDVFRTNESGETAPSNENHDMRSLFCDFKNLCDDPIIIPVSKTKHLSACEAMAVVELLDNDIVQLQSVFEEACEITAVIELGGTNENIKDIVHNVQWQNSYCISSDTHLSEIITLSRNISNRLSELCDVAVEEDWLSCCNNLDDTHTDQSIKQMVALDVQNIVEIRARIANRVQGRRSDLASVVQIRSCFLLLSAIDHSLRLVCGISSEESGASFCANKIFCHEYWLGQIMSSKQNCIQLSDKQYQEAKTILALCKKIQDSGLVLIPEQNKTMSTVSMCAWSNCHLQGLVKYHALIAASTPHMLYKQKSFISYVAHPFMILSEKYKLDVEQTECAKLMAILICHDVENRIIPSFVLENIMQHWEPACNGNLQALNFIMTLFDPCVHSLVECAMGRCPNADLSFITQAQTNVPVTGYNDLHLTNLSCLHIISLQQTLSLNNAITRPRSSARNQ